MKTQRGAISGAVVALIGMFLFVLVIGVIGFSSYVSAFNYGNRTEQQLKGIRDNNKNIYAQGTQKVLEIAQVPGMYADDLQKVIQADIQGRYGKDGSKATMQWLKEHEIKLDSSLYAKIQQMIEVFRNEFQNNQTKMIDVRRSYETQLGNFWGGMWLKLAGYPKVNLADFNPITTDMTETVTRTARNPVH